MNFEEFDSEFCSYVHKNGEKFNRLLKESSIGRIFQYIEDPKRNFAIISANRSDATAKENISNFEELKSIVREVLNLGYIEFVGGYTETVKGVKVEVVEPSIMIPSISKDDAIKLGKKFNQESILFKDENSMDYISTSGNDVGKITTSFKVSAGKQNFTINDLMNPYFSRLKKGANRNDKISFIINERNYNGETLRKSFSNGKSDPLWIPMDMNSSIYGKKLETKKFKVEELPGTNGNAYSGSRYLCSSIKANNKIYGESFDGENIYEAVEFEPDDDHKGGIIVFSTEVNAKKLSDNPVIDKVKKFFKNIYNRYTVDSRLNNIANKHELIGWTVGKYLRGRYRGKNGKTFDENSLSFEIIGVEFNDLISIAEDLCVEFDQESVLVKTYGDNRILFVNAEITESEEDNEQTACAWCDGLFDKSELRREEKLGWLCNSCIRAIGSRGEKLLFGDFNE